MANITISNLDISESYISELNEQELVDIEGGKINWKAVATGIGIAAFLIAGFLE